MFWRKSIAPAIFALSSLVVTAGQNTVPDSQAGFEQQYVLVYESFRTHKDADVQSHLDTFAIPAHWFIDTVGAEQAAGLTQQYSAEFAEFKRRTIANFSGLDAVKAQLNIPPNVVVVLRIRRWTAAENKNTLQGLPRLRSRPPEPQKFDIFFLSMPPSQYGRVSSWIESFIYVDGAFRYFGTANRPFWIPTPPAAKP